VVEAQQISGLDGGGLAPSKEGGKANKKVHPVLKKSEIYKKKGAVCLVLYL
jgi:hypothetical protein